MNILFVCPYTPTLIRMRPFNFIRTLAQRGNAVTLATVWENQTEFAALRELSALGIRVIAEPLTRAQSGVNVLRAAMVGKPMQSLYSWSPALARRLANELANGASRFDVIHVEHLRGAEYGLHIKARRLPVIWDSVDCISFLFEQAARLSASPFGKIAARLELPRTRAYEAKLLGAFDRMLVTSEQDKTAFIELARRDANHFADTRARQISVLQNGVDLAYFVPTSAPRDSHTIVMTGKMSYHANATAAIYLVNQVMPRVWAQMPDVRVLIVGQRPPKQVIALGRQYVDRVTVTGEVPDVRPFLAQATLAIAPIVYGAGIQNKVLEAMAMATPVVATAKAVSALKVQHGKELLVANTPDDFAQAILHLLRDATWRERLGRQGRCYVEEHHDWNKITAQLEQIYESVVVTKDWKRKD